MSPGNLVPPKKFQK